jgi:hypothetical protein
MKMRYRITPFSMSATWLGTGGAGTQTYRWTVFFAYWLAPSKSSAKRTLGKLKQTLRACFLLNGAGFAWPRNSREWIRKDTDEVHD